MRDEERPPVVPVTSDETATATPSTSPDPNATTGVPVSSACAAIPAIPGYEIDGELGRGGMGVVFKARHVTLNRLAAIKMILGGRYTDPIAQARFLVEAEVIARLEHPHIVRVLEFGRVDEQPYFVLEYVGGGSLAGKLERGERSAPRNVAVLVAKLAEAMAAAHEQGVVHRDLKPANVLLTETGEPKVADFGLAKVGESDVTATGAVMGTPSYMAPEQAAGKTKEIGTRTDVYALGAILYEMLTGQPPFRGGSAAHTIFCVMNTEPARPRSLRPDIPRDLETVCLKCLEKDPAARYPTASALSEDLRRYVAGEPVSVRPAGQLERVVKWARRKPTVAAAWALALMVLTLGSVAVFAGWQWRTTAALRDQEGQAREAAETAKQDALEARDVARQAREDAADERERMKYARNVYVAHLECAFNDVARATFFLDLCPKNIRNWEWDYVYRTCHSDLLTFSGHTAGISSAAYSPDGTRVVTASLDKNAKVWDSRTGAVQLSLEGHGDMVHSASFSRDGSKIVTAGYDKTAKVWDAVTGKVVATLGGHKTWVSLAVFTPEGKHVVTAGDEEGAVTVWSLGETPTGMPLVGHTRRVTTAAFNRDGSRLVTAGHDGKTRVWETKTGKCLLTLDATDTGKAVEFAAFTPDGSRIVTSHTHEVRIWDAKTGEELKSKRFNIYNGSDSVSFGLCAVLSPDGSRIAVGYRDRIAVVWDLETGAESFPLPGHTGTVNGIDFSPDGKHIITGSADGTAKVWDAAPPTPWNPKNGRATFFLPGPDRTPCTLAAFSRDGSLAVTIQEDDTFRIWDASTGIQKSALKGSVKNLGWVSFSPDSKRVVASAGIGHTAEVWDIETGKIRFEIKGGTNQTKSEWRDEATGKVIPVVSTRTATIRRARYSPDGKRIMAEYDDRFVKIWDAETGHELLTFQANEEGIWSSDFNFDGTCIITAGGLDKTARIWDASTGKALCVFEGHSDTVTRARFSTDGKRIVTASLDKTAKVWLVETQREILTLQGHTRGLNSAEFNPDGTRIVTTSMDDTVRVWDSKTGFEIIGIQGREGSVHGATFCPDGTRIIAASWDGRGKIWDARPVNGNLPQR